MMVWQKCCWIIINLHEATMYELYSLSLLMTCCVFSLFPWKLPIQKQTFSYLHDLLLRGNRQWVILDFSFSAHKASESTI